MKLKSFNPENAANIRKGKPTIHIGSNGAISMNAVATNLTGLKPGDKVEFHQDETNPKDWYISKSKSGFELRAYNQDRGVIFNSSKLASIILEIIGGPITATMIIGNEPVDGKYWPVITASAKTKE